MEHMQRYQRYPRQARSRNITGTVHLSFTVDLDGKVTRVDVKKSSGSRLLDRACLRMLERAQPLPSPPPNMSVSELSLQVPVRFSLN